MKVTHCFVSYAGDDYQHVLTLRSLNLNPESPIKFVDRSLLEPVINDYGHIIKRPPSDPAAEPVKKEIRKLLEQAGKLLVLLGENTHSHEWVKWEMDAFTSLHGSHRNILLMRVPGDTIAGVPENARHLPACNWDTKKIAAWFG